MAKDDVLELEDTVVEALPNAVFQEKEESVINLTKEYFT